MSDAKPDERVGNLLAFAEEQSARQVVRTSNDLGVIAARTRTTTRDALERRGLVKGWSLTVRGELVAAFLRKRGRRR